MTGFVSSRQFKLWGLVLTFCLGWAELGRITGGVDRTVLDGFFRGAARWWDLPTGVHVAALVLFVGILFWTGRRLIADTPLPDTKIGRALAGLVALLGLYLGLNQFAELNNVASGWTDLGTIHRASVALFAGVDPYAATNNGYFYPPLLAFLFGPLTLLPPVGASTLFFSFKFVMLAWVLLACDRLVDGAHFEGKRRTLFVFGLIFVAARFWIADLQYGNTNVVILFLVIAAIALDREDRQVVAGLALALAISIKIIPVVLCLHFLVARRWRTLLACAAGLVVFNLIPWVLLQGHWPQTWANYLDAGVTGKLDQRLAQPDNQSLWGMINRAFPEESLTTLRAVWAGCAALLAAFVGTVSLKARDREPLAQIASVSLYPLLGLLVSPGSWVVHYTAVLLAMTVLWTVALAGLKSERWAWLLFLVANFAFTVSGWSRPSVNASITQSWFVVTSLILVFGIGAWVLRRGPALADPQQFDPRPTPAKR